MAQKKTRKIKVITPAKTKVSRRSRASIRKIKKQRPRKAIHRKIQVIRPPKNIEYRIPFELKEDEFIVWRNRYGERVKNPRSDTKYIGEIRTKKRKTPIAYANYIKNGRVEPRRFSTRYRKFLEQRVENPSLFPDASQTGIFHFSLHSRFSILSQIQSRGHEAIEAIYQKSQSDGFCAFRIKLRHGLDTPITDTISIRRGTRRHDIAYFIAATIINRIEQTNLRMSSKEMTKNPYKRYIRYLKVEVLIFDVD